jgi:hypothetical protein
MTLFSSPQPYYDEREERNKNPYRGDGGRDFLDYRIDVKSSMIRNRRKRLRWYRLPVRPREFHEHTAYALALIDMKRELAFLMGWAPHYMFPPEVDREGPLKGAFTITAKNLLPIEWLDPKEFCVKEPEISLDTFQPL